VLDEDYGLITFVEQSSSETTVSSQWNLHGKDQVQFLFVFRSHGNGG